MPIALISARASTVWIVLLLISCVKTSQVLYVVRVIAIKSCSMQILSLCYMPDIKNCPANVTVCENWKYQ